MSPQVSCVWPVEALLGEGPVWIEAEQALYFVDIMKENVHRYVPATGDRRTWHIPGRISALVPRARGGWLASSESRIGELDLDALTFTPWIVLPDEPVTNRLNDGKCDPRGRYFTGSMDERKEAAIGSLYMMSADRSVQRVPGDYVITNGPAFSPDGRVMYHADTPGMVIYAYDVPESGVPYNQRVFVEYKDGTRPDGMTVDAEGYLWATRSRGSRITRFAPDGSIERELLLPVSKVTSCSFGGPNYETLYVTSMRTSLDEETLAREPFAGGLLAVETGVRGLPSTPFAG